MSKLLTNKLMNMNQKGFANIILIIVIVALTVVGGYFVLNNRSTTPTPTPLRVCPEKWYDNRMPSTVGSNDVPREYFIYKGVRRELSEFDVNWVKTNCSVKPQAVY